MMMSEINIPDGYWMDAKGCLIPESMIKPIDKERDRLVKELVNKANEVSAVLSSFKVQAFGDIAAFIDLSAEQYDTKVGGQKGNLTLYSFDGKYRVQRAIQDRIAFDERLQAAKELIDQCLHDWTEGARPEIQSIVTNAFATDKEGQINTGRVLTLRRLDIKDDRWVRAMAAIGEAIQVVGSKSYIRVYERIGDSEQYRPIPLDIAGV
jgi:Protein of unknown function (DUF3164).